MTFQHISVHPVGITVSKCSASVTVKAGSKFSFLSSETTKQLGCGGEDNPWLLTAKEGQKINISFIDFYWKLKSRNEDNFNCHDKYGYMVDEKTNDIVNLCGGLTRERNLYVSKGDRLQILIQRNILDDGNFLIGYKGKVFLFDLQNSFSVTKVISGL